MVIFRLFEITFKRDAQSLEYHVQLTARADTRVTEQVESILAPGNLRTALNDQDMQGDLKVYPWYTGFEIDLENEAAELVNYEIGERQTDADGECYRLVTINYQQSIVETQGVSYEDKKTDPKDWEPQIVIREVTRDVIAEVLTFMGAYTRIHTTFVDDVGCEPCLEPVEAGPTLQAVDNGAIKMDLGVCLPVMTTAGEILTKPPSITKTDDEITITRWSEDVQSSSDEESCFKNTINSADFTIDLPKQKYRQTFPKHTVRLNAIQKELKEYTWEINEIPFRKLYWEKRYVLMYRPGGWFIDVVNAGKKRAAGDGDPDGEGGTILLADLLDTEPRNAQITRDGFADGLHRLDLEGQPFIGPDLSVVMRYLEPETDFRSDKLDLPTTDKVST